MDFAIDDDVAELASSVAGFFTRRDDARLIASGTANGAAADVGRWVALCDLGLPALRLAAPRGIGASVLDATVLAEELGAVLLPEPASASIVLARLWDEFGGSVDTLAALLTGSTVTSFVASEPLTRAPGGDVSGRLRLADDDATEFVVLPTESALVLVKRSSCEAAGERRTTDPSRPTRMFGLTGVTPVEVLPMTPVAIVAAADELAVLTVGELVGGMQRVLDETVRYASERRQFGRSIGSFQSVKHRLADMYVATEQARAAVQFAAVSLDRRSDNATADVAAAARWVPRAAIDLFDHAIHLHGAMGYSWEVDVHLQLRRALATRTLLIPRYHSSDPGRLAS